MSDDKLRADVVQGQHAVNLLTNEAFKNAVDHIREGLITRWVATTDIAERDRIWVAVNLLAKITDALIVAVNNGKVATAEIEAMVAAESKAA